MNDELLYFHSALVPGRRNTEYRHINASAQVVPCYKFNQFLIMISPCGVKTLSG